MAIFQKLIQTKVTNRPMTLVINEVKQGSVSVVTPDLNCPPQLADLNFNPTRARGVGEIGITGVAVAIANAIYHATGKRLRSLPITPDKLLDI